jgi:hypothetical protein
MLAAVPDVIGDEVFERPESLVTALRRYGLGRFVRSDPG